MKTDWHESIRRHISGASTEEESDTLQEAMKQDQDLRHLYLDYINLDLALEAKADAMNELPEAESVIDLNHERRHSNTRWQPIAIAAALILMFATLAGLYLPSRGEPVAQIKSAHRTTDFSAGELLRPGQRFAISQGRVKISFESGAILAVEAPADLKILGPNSARLKHGRVTVRVPGKIKGFILHTPQQRVTDLGTSFGVNVDTAGKASISVFEGEIEIGDDRRLLAGKSVTLATSDEAPREIPYTEENYAETWQISFGIEALKGKVRLAAPSERPIPGQVEDSEALLLFPERENVTLAQGYLVDAVDPGLHRRPFRKSVKQLNEATRADSFLLQYNPVRSEDATEHKFFEGELHFDRPIVALILQKDLLDASDTALALPGIDFDGIFRRGINTADEVTLSSNRRTLHITFDLLNGVDQIRVLVASAHNQKSQ